MQKSQMNATDLATHHLVVSALVAAGWEPQRDQLAFDEGEWTLYDIDMQRFNGRMRLRVFRDPTSDELGLALRTTQGQTVGLYLKCGDRLRDVLDVIVEMQDVIDEGNYRQHVACLVQVCPEIYSGTDDVARVRIVTTNVK
jgi:hypothetical protein